MLHSIVIITDQMQSTVDIFNIYEHDKFPA